MANLHHNIETSFGGALAAVVRRDLVARLGLVVLVLALPLYLLPFFGSELLSYLSARLHPFLLLVLVLVALRRDLQELSVVEERRFWKDLAVAFGAWLAIATVYLFFPTTEKPLAVDLAAEILFAVYYLALILAIEREPHRRHRWRPAGLERALTWPSATIFVSLCLIYFVLIPLIADRQAYESTIPSMALYGTLDAYLAIKATYLAFLARDLRWRSLYRVLAVAFGILLLSDLYEGWLYATAQTWGRAIDWLWSLPFVVLIIAARLRHVRFPTHFDSPGSVRQQESSSPGPSSRTMIAALSFPVIHFGCYAFGLLDEATRPAREIVVLGGLLLLGTIALVQRLILDRRVQELWLDRKRVEDALLESEKDLRVMLARKQAAAAVSLSEEKFTKAFRASPDAMGITTEADGRYLELNDGFEEVTGYQPQDAIGRHATDLNLWWNAGERDEIIEELRRTGSVRNREVRYRHKSGEERIALYSAERLEIDEEACLLFVARDITEPYREQRKLRQQVSLLDRASVALCVVEAGDERIAYWNRAAELLYGRPAAAALGETFREVLCQGDSTTADEVRQALSTDEEWRGELQIDTDGGNPRTITSHWLASRDEAERPVSWLVISRRKRDPSTAVS